MIILRDDLREMHSAKKLRCIGVSETLILTKNSWSILKTSPPVFKNEALLPLPGLWIIKFICFFRIQDSNHNQTRTFLAILKNWKSENWKSEIWKSEIWNLFWPIPFLMDPDPHFHYRYGSRSAKWIQADQDPQSLYEYGSRRRAKSLRIHADPQRCSAALFFSFKNTWQFPTDLWTM